MGRMSECPRCAELERERDALKRFIQELRVEIAELRAMLDAASERILELREGLTRA